MSIAELQVCAVESADVTGGVCVVRCIGGVARSGQVFAAGALRTRLRGIERYGRTVGSFDAGHVAKVRLTGPVVALLAPGQVLTYVPPDGHALAELEDWLAADPPLSDEPHSERLRCLATLSMRNEELPDGVRLRWARIALAALDRLGRPEERPYVHAYLIGSLGSGEDGDPDRDPAALCREVLARFELTPDQAAAQARVWRDLRRPEILRLRRIKNLLRCTEAARPYLAATDPLAAAVDAWTAVRPGLP
ncbi:hypothetical protein OG730_20480 [Streptomyces sp. NBC_01298]|uniref:hypothetical protein n=1 Tax=Streptomyces sp. NBC_01298 TaxID=2903817 RepID=UPI002E147867|nr:hypothetical protein OG730_20480 [Streptomyces sp. NBC_01298]